MKNRWSLCVKNFGKIESAEIEVSPLMIFIGDKNHGYVGMDNTEMIWYSLSRICYFLLIEPYKSWEYKK